jgi:ubiquinone/menaquinone biosynthesis C-methylase UbiE
MKRMGWLVTSLSAIAAIGVCLIYSVAVPRARGDQRQEIERLAQLMQWKPGAIVADIGAGDGSYSFVAAELVGASGRVYAVEIDKDKLRDIRAEVAKRKLANVTVIEDTAEDAKLPSGCCDAIYLRHVYHHLTRPGEFDKSIVRSLKAGGRLAIIDFPPEEHSALPEGVPENRGGHGIPQKIMVEELSSAGLVVEKVIGDWSHRDYCVIFVKRGE